MKNVYVLTKNGVLITRAFFSELEAKRDCRNKNAKVVAGIKYSYKRIQVADS